MRSNLLLLTTAALTACTQQLPDSFRFKQQEQTFNAALAINTSVDILWVVDNSASMDVSQGNLRTGFAAFADKYMKPTWDIQVAVISTDTYMANSAFNTYLTTTLPGTVNYVSPYIDNKVNAFVNPASTPNLVNPSTGAFPGGFRFKDIFPLYGAGFARLEAGKHDGPIPALCFEVHKLFLDGLSMCDVRDDNNPNTGVDSCLNPGGGENSITECVNTTQNNTVRSGKAIIKTKPPTGVAGNQAWTDQLLKDFKINITTGSAGHGSERAFGSVSQLLNDNEGTATKFFRENSQRAVIFVGDEDDQTLDIPSTPPAGFNPWTYYKCDQAQLVADNPSSNITGAGGYCCAGGSCLYGTEGLACPSKTVGSHTYKLSVCAREDKLKTVSAFKEELDTFFNNLDGGTEPNYLVAAIVPTTDSSIQNLQAARDAVDSSAGVVKVRASDRADRIIDLTTQVGNGSLVMEIDSPDYSPILDAIGEAIVQKAGKFKLNRPPTGEEDAFVKLIREGQESLVDPDYYEFQGDYLILTDLDFILSLQVDDQILVNYQPKE